MFIYMHIQLIQVMDVEGTCTLVTMEGALVSLIGVIAIMTVEITVTKIDVSGGRRDFFCNAHNGTAFGPSLRNVCIKVVYAKCPDFK